MNKLSSDNSPLLEDATDPAGYENDFLLWVEQQVELLRAKKFEQLDLNNIIEEMESMGKSLRRELGSRLKVLLMHLLKCEYQPEKKSVSWLGTIAEQRDEIEALLEDNPSLQADVASRSQRAYAQAVRAAARETGLPETTFPPDNPYSAGQLLDHGFFP